jgi:hypothetical protein
MTQHDQEPRERSDTVETLHSPWLTAQQAAERSGRHVVRVRAALLSGDLHGHQRRDRGHWRVHVDALDAWVGADASSGARVSQRACACQRAVPTSSRSA